MSHPVQLEGEYLNTSPPVPTGEITAPVLDFYSDGTVFVGSVILADRFHGNYVGRTGDDS